MPGGEWRLDALDLSTPAAPGELGRFDRVVPDEIHGFEALAGRYGVVYDAEHNALVVVDLRNGEVRSATGFFAWGASRTYYERDPIHLAGRWLLGHSGHWYELLEADGVQLHSRLRGTIDADAGVSSPSCRSIWARPSSFPGRRRPGGTSSRSTTGGHQPRVLRAPRPDTGSRAGTPGGLGAAAHRAPRVLRHGGAGREGEADRPLAGHDAEPPPPGAIAGDDRQFECAAPGGTPLRPDGSASFDPDSAPGTQDDIEIHRWRLDGVPAGSGATVDVVVSPGEHRIELEVEDVLGATGVDGARIAVLDTEPPAVTLGLTPVLGERRLAHSWLPVADAVDRCEGPLSSVVRLASLPANAVCFPGSGIRGLHQPGWGG